MSNYLNQKFEASQLIAEYQRIRSQTEFLCRPLEIEDYGLQVMPDVSPPKWHLAHTTWFFETFLLKALLPDYVVVHSKYEYLFNSYYNAIGKQYPRSQRGWISRPTVQEIYDYRKAIDEKMLSFLQSDQAQEPDVQLGILLGINHEQQHQELLLTDLKYSWAQNPLYPVYGNAMEEKAIQHESMPLHYVAFEGGLIETGFDQTGFSFDNERPRHKSWVEPFLMANRLVTNGEYLEFIEDGGYQQPQLWLSDGWIKINKGNKKSWRAPYYWVKQDGQWFEYSLQGLKPLLLDQPVCHVSAYEADAYARWAGKQLPSEAQWEHAAQISLEQWQQHKETTAMGNFVENQCFHPHPCTPTQVLEPSTTLHQMLGDVWEWTSSNYSPYPGFKPFPDTMSEYNGKFMSNQLVLRGGSCVTPQGHIRTTYRNFFYPKDRWQFSGIRLIEAL